MNKTIEETIREIVQDELSKSPLDNLPPTTLEEFAEKIKMSRVQLWRWERQGKLKVLRLGKKIYIPASEVIRICQIKNIVA